MNRLITISLFIILFQNTYSQEWHKKFNTNTESYSNSIIETNNLLFITVNETNNFSIIKTDLNGTFIEAKIISSILRASIILKTNDNNIIVVGLSNNSQDDIIIIKLDLNLNHIWTFNLNLPQYQYPESAIINSNNDISICGFSSSSASSTNDRDGLIIRIDNMGQLIWSKTIATGGSDYFSGLAEDNNYNILLTGAIEGGLGLMDIIITKIDNSGNILLSKCYGGSLNDGGYSVEFFNNSYYISGNSWSTGFGMQDMMLLKLDVDLNLEFSKSYGGSNIEPGLYVKSTTSGEILLAGQTLSVPSKKRDVCFILLDTNGEIIRMKSYGDSNDETIAFGYKFVLEKDGYYYFTTGSKSINNFQETTLSKVDLISNDNCCNLNQNPNFTSLDANLNFNNINYNIVNITSATQTTSSSVNVIFNQNNLCDNTSTITTNILTNNTTFCINSPISFSASSNSFGNTYKWDFGDPNSGPENNSTNENPNHEFSAIGTFLITLIAEGACASDTDTMSVTVIESIDLETQINSAKIIYCINDTVSFTSTSNDPNPNYFWNFNDPNSGANNFSNIPQPIHRFTTAGTYDVSLITLNTCHVDTAYFSIQITPISDADFEYSVNSCLGYVEFINTSTNLTSNNYAWFIDNVLISSNQNATTEIVNEGTHSISLVLNPNSNCVDTITKEINFIIPDNTYGILIPDAFSPNNDGINDIFKIQTNYDCKLQKMIVFNRWGEKIYESSNVFEWRGNENNKFNESGTYVVYIEFDNNKHHKTIQLIR